MEPKPYILMLEDDEDDRYITKTFFAEKNFNINVEFLEKSSDVLPFLHERVAKNLPLPRLIMLDRNAPPGDPMDVLREIKTVPALRFIPVVMLSGTGHPKEVTEAYRLGVNSYIVKPFSTEQTSRKIKSFLDYWFETVELPQQQ